MDYPDLPHRLPRSTGRDYCNTRRPAADRDCCSTDCSTRSRPTRIRRNPDCRRCSTDLRSRSKDHSRCSTGLRFRSMDCSHHNSGRNRRSKDSCHRNTDLRFRNRDWDYRSMGRHSTVHHSMGLRNKDRTSRDQCSTDPRSTDLDRNRRCSRSDPAGNRGRCCSLALRGSPRLRRSKCAKCNHRCSQSGPIRSRRRCCS